eukprot:scaffold26962_cov114-Isochrysis_galbana.AAC.6
MSTGCLPPTVGPTACRSTFSCGSWRTGCTPSSLPAVRQRNYARSASHCFLAQNWSDIASAPAAAAAARGVAVQVAAVAGVAPTLGVAPSASTLVPTTGAAVTTIVAQPSTALPETMLRARLRSGPALAAAPIRRSSSLFAARRASTPRRMHSMICGFYCARQPAATPSSTSIHSRCSSAHSGTGRRLRDG